MVEKGSIVLFEIDSVLGCSLKKNFENGMSFFVF